ncbi:MAG: ATP-binding cassette domain-containing protein [Deinococcota bacterium]
MASEHPLLKLEHYSKQFYIHHLGRQVAAFEGLNITIDPGEFVLVSGPNGIGKSTLLRCLYRSYRATGGQAWYESAYGAIDLALAADIDIAKLRREELGFVTQFLRARPRVSALELVAEPLLTELAYDQALERAANALAAFGLKEELWQAYPSTFSGGEQQKVNLARALIVPRRLLLLDEPTASLDAQARRALTTRLADLKTQGVTMIGVFHHPEDVLELIDKRLELASLSPDATQALSHAIN